MWFSNWCRHFSKKLFEQLLKYTRDTLQVKGGIQGRRLSTEIIQNKLEGKKKIIEKFPHSVSKGLKGNQSADGVCITAGVCVFYFYFFFYLLVESKLIGWNVKWKLRGLPLSLGCPPQDPLGGARDCFTSTKIRPKNKLLITRSNSPAQVNRAKQVNTMHGRHPFRSAGQFCFKKLLREAEMNKYVFLSLEFQRRTRKYRKDKELT